MKSFIYTYHEKTKSNGVEKTVNVYRIYKNRIQPVGTITGTITGMSLGSFQLVMEVLEREKALPAVAFARHPKGHAPIYGNAWRLEQDGIAIVERVV